MDLKKINFIKNDFIALVKKIEPNCMPAWGKMNVQQMVEHMSDSFRIANGKQIHTSIISPIENLPKMKAFLLSDIPFKENTKNKMLGETPLPVNNNSLQKAIEELEKEVNYFFEVFENNPDKIILNPIFGELNYNEWIHLLYKHATHHLKQFSLLKEE